MSVIQSIDEVHAWCRRWRVAELAVFGSAIRPDFDSESDIDLIVTFAPEANWSLLDHVQMEDELSAVLGKPVDLVTRQAVERSTNWLRRAAILDSAQVIYRAAEFDYTEG